MTFYEEGDYASLVTVTIGNAIYQLPIRVHVRRTGEEAPTLPVIKLPASLKTIEEYAFEESSAQAVDLRDTQATTIGAGAFRNCVDLAIAYIPATVTSIADDAFYGCLNLTIICRQGSSADSYAQQHNINVQYE